MRQKGTDLHAATVVGDTVGDPFKDTSSVAMNPVIKFTTLFGLLAVELGVYLSNGGSGTLSRVLSVAFFLCALLFISSILHAQTGPELLLKPWPKKETIQADGSFMLDTMSLEAVAA